jgi:hypothetical protein
VTHEMCTTLSHVVETSTRRYNEMFRVAVAAGREITEGQMDVHSTTRTHIMCNIRSAVYIFFNKMYVL